MDGPTLVDATDTRWLRWSRRVRASALLVATAAVASTLLLLWRPPASQQGAAPAETLSGSITTPAGQATPSSSVSQPTASAWTSAPAPGSGGGHSRPGAAPTPGCRPRFAVWPHMHESAPYPAFRVAWRADDWVPEAVGCEDERIRVFWVSYIVGTNGDLTHFDSEVGWVDAQHPSVTMVIRLPQFNGLFCDGRWYLVVGNQPVKQSVASADVGYTFRRETGPYPWTEDGQGAIGADKTPPCSLYETPAPSTAEAGAGTPGWGS